jgi:hypothetical protein
MKNIFHNPDNQQLNVMDSRYYTNNGVDFFPSVTTVLEAFPQSWALAQWKKSVGFNADIILEKAAAEGSAIHDAIERYLGGEEITYHQYNLTEWQCILRFVEFWQSVQPLLEASETIIVSPALRLGGTVDIVCVINGERWLIDAKSSNSVHDTMEYQLAAYATMWNEQHPGHKIDRRGILHLKAATRGPDKTGKKIQGKGWQLIEFPRHYSDAWRLFEHLRVIWDELNPDYRPANLVLPDRVQLTTVNALKQAV